MKFFITKIVSIFLAFIVLFSTMSFSVKLHHCHKHLYSMSIFKNVKTCEMNVKMTSSSKSSIENDADCCITQTHFKKGDNEIIRASNEVKFKTFFFLYSYINFFEGLKKNTIPFLNYDPPLIFNDIIVLHETFLI